MNMKYKMVAAMSAVVMATAFVSTPASAGRVITNVYTNPSGPVPAKGYVGSYYKSQTVWGDGIEHVNEIGTTFNTVYYITGADYTSCHNSLLAAMNANGYTGWTDCSPQ